MNEDERLKRAFEALRRHDERGARPFRRPIGDPERAKRRWRPIFMVAPAGLAVAAAALLFTIAGRRNAPSAMAPPDSGRPRAGVAADVAPLDFLLEPPRSSVVSNHAAFEASVLPGVRP